MVGAGHLSWEKELFSEESFSFHVLDDTTPEDPTPLVSPELDQQLQVRIFLESLLLSFVFTKYSEWLI